MNAETIRELVKKQSTYIVDPSVRQEFNKIREIYQVYDNQGNVMVAGFPVETSDAEMRMVARILQGKLVPNKTVVVFALRDSIYSTQPCFKSIGQKCIPGVVRNGTIIATYPELTDNYDIKQYNLMKEVAETLGGRMENIVHTMWVRISV